MLPNQNSISPWNFIDYVGTRKGTWKAIQYLGRSIWLIECDCGIQKKIKAGNWRSGHGTKRCSCQPRPTNYNQLAPGEASFNMLVSRYQTKAAKRGIAFNLSTESFRELTRSDCSYCGLPPSGVCCTGSGTPYVYTGVDRVDSNRGYEHDNVVPCCGLCNRAKSDLSIDEWKAWLRRVSERLL